MAKAGRKKKPGARYAKNRRLTRAARAEDAMETAVAARMRLFGVTETAAKDADLGFPLGRLYKRGYIKAPQYEAGNRFAGAMRDYMLSKGIGAATAQAADFNRRGASLSERPVRHEQEAREYMEALAEVDRLNPARRSATSLVWEVCLREESEHMGEREIGMMREGLNAIARVITRRERMKRAA